MDFPWTRSLGLALSHRDVPRHVTTWARAAERAELGSVWIIEDYFQPGAFTLAGAAAAAAPRVVVGIGVINPYTRHPALLAMETAALAGIAPGRVVLGIGSSNKRWIAEQMGIPFTAPLTAVRESVEIVRRLLAGERLSYGGQTFHLEGVVLESRPEERVPMFLGVKGPKALAMAAEVADGVLCSVLASPAHVKRVRAAVGRERAVIAYVPVMIDADATRARDALKPLLARYLGVLHGQSILADAGLDPGRTERFREALLRGDDASHLVSADVIDAVAIAGTPEDCRHALLRYAKAGLDTLIAVIPRGADMTWQIERLGALSKGWNEMRWR